MSKFKNYKNSINQSDRIYSVEDINKMPLRDFKTNSQVLLAQNSAIGLPNESELASSPNAVYVEPYTRADGTRVRGYWRSRPDGDGAPAESQSGVQKLYGYISNKDEKKEESAQNTAEMQKKNNNQKQIYLDKNNNIQIGDYKIGKPEKESWFSGGKYIRNPLRVINRMLNRKDHAAREMYDLSARKPELLVNRPHYIVANDADKETLRKQNIVFNNNKPTLIFTPKSPEYKAVVTSKDMKNELKKWFANEKIEGKVRPDKFSVVLADNQNVFKSIHGATIRNVRDNGDGTISFVLTDLYDYTMIFYKIYSKNHKTKRKGNYKDFYKSIFKDRDSFIKCMKNLIASARHYSNDILKYNYKNPYNYYPDKNTYDYNEYFNGDYGKNIHNKINNYWHSANDSFKGMFLTGVNDLTCLLQQTNKMFQYNIAIPVTIKKSELK